MRDANPGADFLIHPECGCSTSVMEYVASGDVDAENTHMLSTGGMLTYARDSRKPTRFIVATETGMLHPLEQENPGQRPSSPANRAAVCQYMKMITLPKLRDALRDGGDSYTVKVRSGDRRARAGADRAHGGDLGLSQWPLPEPPPSSATSVESLPEPELPPEPIPSRRSSRSHSCAEPPLVPSRRSFLSRRCSCRSRCPCPSRRWS